MGNRFALVMIRPTLRIIIEVLAAMAVGVIVLAGIAIWRLSSGPVEVNFLTPAIEAALSDPVAGLDVEVGRTVVTWEGWPKTFDTHAQDVQLRLENLGGQTTVALPKVAVTFSLRALLQGQFAPTVIEIFGAQVSVLRTEEGQLRFGGGPEVEDARPDHEFSHWLAKVLQVLKSDQRQDLPLSYLDILRVRQGTVLLADEGLDLSLEASAEEFEVRRDGDGVTGKMLLALAAEEQTATFDASFRHARETQRTDLAISFEKLSPAVMQSIVPEWSFLAGIRTAFAGSIDATLLEPDWRTTIDFQATGEPGTLVFDGVLPVAHPFNMLFLQGHYASQTGRIALQQLHLDLGQDNEPGPRLDAKADLEIEEGSVVLSAEAVATQVPLDDLASYWPEDLAPIARRWVIENIRTGVAEEARLKLDAGISADDPSDIVLQGLSGSLLYRDLDVHYLRPLPPVSRVAGRGTFDSNSLRLSVKSGELGDIAVSPTRVDILALDTEDPRIDIALQGQGPFRDILELLDHPELGLIAALGQDPVNARGSAEVSVGFRFPLRQDLTFDDVEVDAHANLAETTMANVLLGRDLYSDNLALTVNNRGLQIIGPVQYDQAHATIDWYRSFLLDEPVKRRITLSRFEVDERARHNLGANTGPLQLIGLVKGAAEITQWRGGDLQADVVLNLAETGISFPQLAWQKSAGQPGRAAFSLHAVEDKVTRIDPFDAEIGDLRANGRIQFGADGEEDRVTLSELRFSRNDLRQVDLSLSDDGTSVFLGGGALDVEPFWGIGDQSEDVSAGTKGNLGPRALTLKTGELDRIRFSENHFLEKAAIALQREGPSLTHFGAQGEIPRNFWLPPQDPTEEAAPSVPAKKFTVAYHADEAGPSQLSAEADDIGALLRALGVVETVAGGRLQINGARAGAANDGPFRGHIDVRDFVLTEAPNLARLLTIASFSGLVDLLGGAGIRFDQLVGDFTLTEGVLASDLLRAYGDALGLTAEGQIDLDSLEAEIAGTLVPAYSINRVLGNIPLLGPVLTGGEGQGVVAVTYGIEGDLRKPQISVNPLSALTPGFLRALFGIFDGEAPNPDTLKTFPEEQGR